LYEILFGNKQLFDGLWINSSNYDWKAYGVISLDFSKIECHSSDVLNDALKFYLNKIAHAYNIESLDNNLSTSVILETLVDKLFKKYGRVAILIDEYDAPILKTLKNKEL